MRFSALSPSERVANGVIFRKVPEPFLPLRCPCSKPILDPQKRRLDQVIGSGGNQEGQNEILRESSGPVAAEGIQKELLPQV